ncbi:MAG: hypothetical protein WCK16_00865 [Candidatus Moraniibacteriota bacterium]
MKNKRGNVAVIALIIVIVAITTGVITWLIATKTQAPVQQAVVTQPAPVAKTQPVVQSTTPTAQSTPASDVSKQGIKEYKSGNTFSFNYPSQVCDPESKKCYPIVLSEDKSVITLNASEGGLFKIYYGTNITDDKSANNFLQTTLKNGLCKIDTTETNMLQGTTIKNVFLDGGCSLYGPAYEKYSSAHPDAIGLAGKNRAYWATDSKEMIVYVLGQGGGCSFLDCELEGKISESINLGGINVFDKSMSGI